MQNQIDNRLSSTNPYDVINIMKTVKLTHTFRLPEELQADALRLLEVSRDTVNAIIERLWDRLD